MRMRVARVVLAVLGMLMGTVKTLSAATSGSDEASGVAYDDGWQTGDNGGSGLGPWMLLAEQDMISGWAGHFCANSGNTDLNYIQCSTDHSAWGMYANGDDSL